MNIVYHHRTLGKGVEGVHISGVIKGFIHAGHSVTEVSLGDSQATHTGKKETKKSSSVTRKTLRLFVDNAPNFLFRVSEFFYNFVGFFKLKKVLKELDRVDLIYDRYAYFSFVSIVIGSLYKVPVITEVNITTDFDDTRKIQFRYLCRRIEQLILEKSDLIVVVSHVLKRKIAERGIQERKIFVQPNGFNPEYLSVDVSRITTEIFCSNSNGEVTLCFLGRLLPWYQLDKLLVIFAEVKKEYNDISLLIIGDGPERSKLENYVSEYELDKDVFFTGNVSHLEALTLLSYSDICLLLATNHWTSPVKLFEYMGAGKAVIAPNIESVTSIMTNELHGKLFVEGDFVDFKRVLLSLLSSEADLAKIGNACRRHIEQNHTWDQVSQNILVAASQQKII